jgi:spore coat polysaccharide biosynthesis predicted glycosyltransferase SpsG
MASQMREADLIFTSAGRTTFEIACVGTPAIVIAQNERELTHLFATADHGFLNLGLAAVVGDDEIVAAFERLVTAYRFEDIDVAVHDSESGKVVKAVLRF